MCIYIHQRIGRGVIVAARSHHEGRLPSWTLVVERWKARIFLIFCCCCYCCWLLLFAPFASLSENRSLHWGDRQPWRETGWGHAALIEPWEGKRERAREERPPRLVTWCRARGGVSGARLDGGKGAFFKGTSRVWKVGRSMETTPADATGGKTRWGGYKEGNRCDGVRVRAPAPRSRMKQGGGFMNCRQMNSLKYTK